MRFLLIVMMFLSWGGAACAQAGVGHAPPVDEYNNVKPGLMMEEAVPEAAATAASESRAITMTIEDVVSAYHQGKFDLVAKNIMPLAENGYHQAEELLGLMYRAGQGFEKNPQNAALWLSRAAEAGQPLAEHHLGVAYYSGDGVAADNARALMWLRLAILHYPDGPEKKRAMEDFANLSSQTLRRDREHAEDMARDWLDKKGEKRLLDTQ